MKARVPVRTVFDRQGNILYGQYEEMELDDEQKEAICALLVNAFIEKYSLKEA